MPTLAPVLLWGLRAVPFLLLAWIVTLLLRRGSAAQRHFIWAVAVIGSLLVPVAGLLAPRITLAVLPAPPAAAADPGAWLEPSPALPTAAAPAPSGRAIPRSDPGWGEGRAGTWSLPSLLAVWALGAAGVGLLILISAVGTAQLARRARPVTAGRLLRELESARRTLGLGRSVRLLVAENVMPMTWGIAPASVLLPTTCREWSPGRRRAVLLHELAHVRRRDWGIQLLARISCAIHWWNPLTWLAARKLREERELACDDLVLTHGAAATEYAHDLLEIARGLRSPPVTALAGIAMARPSQLAGRLRAVLDGNRSRGPVARRRGVAGVLLMTGLMIPVAGLRVVRAGAAAPSLDEPAPAPPETLLRSVEELRAAPSYRPAHPARTLCDWSSRSSSQSSNTNINDDDVTIRIEVGPCELQVRSRGRVEFAPDDRTVSAVESGGYFEIDERRGGERRRAEFDRRDGALQRRWYVNGREQAWSDDAAAWLEGALLAMFRRTSFQARERAERIHQAGGKEALLAEIEQLHSSSALSRYLTVLLERERLSSSEALALATRAGEWITSSSGLGSVLVALLGNAGLDETARATIVRSAERIGSSSSRAMVLVAATETGPLTPGLADAVLQTAEEISSSGEKGRVLHAVAARLPADRPLPGSFFTAARSISSSSELGRVLRAALARRPLDPGNREGFFRAARQIGSSSEKEHVLTAVVQSDPDPEAVAQVIELSQEIGSSSARANVLVAVARGGLLTTASLRSAYREAAQGIGSRSERERALAALERG